MVTQSTPVDLPPHLYSLSAKINDLPDAVRDALQATLSVAKYNATPEQALTDTFARLGYLPEEATRATERILAWTAGGSPRTRTNPNSRRSKLRWSN